MAAMRLRKITNGFGVLAASVGIAACMVLALLPWSYFDFAYADEPDGNVSFRAVFDRGAYVSGDSARLSLIATNNSKTDITDVSYEVSLPDVLDGSNAQIAGELGDIKAGGVRTTEIVIPVASSKPTPIGAVVEDGTVADEDDVASGDLSATGDSALLWISLIGVACCALGILALCQKKKKAANRANVPYSMLSVLLVVCLSGLLGVADAATAFASESKMTKEAYASCSVNGESVQTVAMLSWIAQGGNTDSGSGDSEKDDASDDRPQGIVYQDGVVVLDSDQASGFDVDEVSAWVSESANVGIGDIVVINPDPSNGVDRGGVMRVTSVDLLEDGRIIHGEIPACNQVLKSINLEGVTNQVVSVDWAEGVYESPKTLSPMEVQSRGSIGGNALLGELARENTIDLGDMGKVTASLVPSLDYALDYSWTSDPLPEVHRARLGLTTDANLTYEIQDGFEKTISLCKAEFIIPDTPLFITAQICLVISGEGSVEISASTQLSTGFEYTERSGVSPFVEASSEASAKLEADAEVVVRPSLVLSFVGVFELGDASISAGYHAHGEVFQRNESLRCSEIAGWMVVSLSAGESDVLAELFERDAIEASWDLLGENDNPTRQAFHFENGEQVSECTWGQGGEGGDPEPPDPIDPVEPVEPSTPSDDGAAGTLVAGRAVRFAILPGVNAFSSLLKITGYDASPDCIAVATVVKDGTITQKVLLTPGTKPLKTINLLSEAPAFGFPYLDPYEMAYKPGYSEMYMLVEVVKGSLENMYIYYPGEKYTSITWQNGPQYNTVEEAYQDLKCF